MRTGARLASGDESAQIGAVAGSRLADFKPDDLADLGVSGWVEALERGVAFHHAGMVSAFKETVEQCFAEGLVKGGVRHRDPGLGGQHAGPQRGD